MSRVLKVVSLPELPPLVDRAKRGDLDAFVEIVRRFQDMAFGCAYSILRDFQLAEDAAQEAFLEAYASLPNLRNTTAFPVWFRRIVFKRCDRLTRRNSISTVPLTAALRLASEESDPTTEAERKELREEVRIALATLPPKQLEVTTLYYVGDYSHREISEFLGVPISTIKNRLHSARKAPDARAGRNG